MRKAQDLIELAVKLADRDGSTVVLRRHYIEAGFSFEDREKPKQTKHLKPARV